MSTLDRMAEGAGLSADELELLEMLWEEEGVELESEESEASIPRRQRDRDIPLSFAQKRLWILDQLNPGHPTLNISIALALDGDLQQPALAAALAELVQRHESLRTSFSSDLGEPVQNVLPAFVPELPRIDLTGLSANDRDRETRRLASAEAWHSFDLGRGPLLRARLLIGEGGRHVLLLTVHHIIADGWSMEILQLELAELYRAAALGQPANLPSLPVQYPDFAEWQAEWLKGDVLDAQLEYWRERLGGERQTFELATDRPRPAVLPLGGDHYPVTLSAELTTAIREFSREQGGTVFITLLAAWKALLLRHDGPTDMILGTPVANRRQREIEGLIGMFFNLLALRSDLSGDPSFSELAGRVRGVALDAFAHQDLPFEKLLDELAPERDPSRTPLFETTFVLQSAPDRLSLPSLTLSPIEIERRPANFDLNLQLVEGPDQVTGYLEYRTELYDRTTVARLARHFVALLEGAVANAEERLSVLPLLSPAERHQLSGEWNDTVRDFRRQTLMHQLFEEQATRTPDAIAVHGGGEAWSYGHLERESQRLAVHLRSLGVRRGTLVALHLERTPRMIPALLAVLKAGGTYVPLETSYPSGRVRYILEAMAIPVILSGPASLEVLTDLPVPSTLEHVVCLEPLATTAPDLGTTRLTTPADFPASSDAPWPIDRDADPSDAGDFAYIIFTSGSTGAPKGVMVRHRPAINLIEWVNRRFDLGASDRLLFITSLCFDLSVYDVFGILASGGSLRVASDDEVGDAQALIEILTREAITFWDSAPAALQQLVPVLPPDGAGGGALRLVFLSGDWVPLSLPDQVRASFPAAQMIALGGATEATVWSNFFPIDEIEPHWLSVPYGRPIQNARYYVLDDTLEPCAVGIPGDLFIGGDCLSTGYAGAPRLTAGKYVPDSAAGGGTGDEERDGDGVMYRTGDRARFRADGNIEFLGRLDHQIKLRGFRIELGEIESVLSRHAGVREALVTVREDTPGSRRLVAYVVPTSESEATAEDVDLTEQWQMVYDGIYSQEAPSADPTFNTSGWIDSTSGQLISAEAMHEWVDTTVDRLKALAPQRVLEVGCGTGMLLYRLAPECKTYLGTDISEVGLKRLGEEVGSRQELGHVRLEQRAADDWQGIEPGSFDLVVINSVTQHFRDVDYLLQVIEGAVAATAAGGAVFIGDMRSLPLLEAHHVAVELHKAADDLSRESWRGTVRRRIASEEELLIDPGFYHALPSRLEAITGVRTWLRRGRFDHEMNRYRYDAVLEVGGTAPETAPPEAWRDFRQQIGGLERLRHLLESERPEVLGVRAIANARLATERRAIAWLDDTAEAAAGPATVGEFRAALGTDAVSVEPQAVWNLGEELDYRVEIGWSAGEPPGDDSAPDATNAAERTGDFDVLLSRRPLTIAALDRTAPADWSRFTNQPWRAAQQRLLVPQLTAFAGQHLPEYMMPAAWVALDEWPMTRNGKIDRAALPPPDDRTSSADAELVAPSTPTEEQLAAIVCEVLGREQVSVHDNFFEFGGDSILSIQVIARANQQGMPLTTQQFFQHQTIAELASVVAEAPQAEATGESSAAEPAAPSLDDGDWKAEHFPEADLDEESFDILMDQIG